MAKSLSRFYIRKQDEKNEMATLFFRVQNYFFTPEIEIVKQLKNNEVWYIFMAFSKALKKATELAKSNFTNM